MLKNVDLSLKGAGSASFKKRWGHYAASTSEDEVEVELRLKLRYNLGLTRSSNLHDETLALIRIEIEDETLFD